MSVSALAQSFMLLLGRKRGLSALGCGQPIEQLNLRI